MKKLIFTSIFGPYDDLKEPQKPNPDWTFVCFTNQDLKSDTWDIVKVEGDDNRKLSRRHKIPNLFPEYDLSIFIDATFEIKRQSLDKFALSKTNGIWLNAHPQRSCVYEEAAIVIEKGLDDADLVTKQIERYRAEGLPANDGLCRCGIMVRNPKDDKITEMCNVWMKEVEENSWRDQISFMYACWKTGVVPNEILHGITQIYFKQHLHKPRPTDTWTFVGEGDYDKSLTEKYQGAHLIILKNGLLYPEWINLYISLKSHGRDRFIELIKILNGIVVHG
jgi:hypothetical protein